jgi:hypothetical protein
MGKRDAAYAPLIAVRMEILNKVVAGSHVYAAVHGCGVGDSPAEAVITTDWLGGQSWPCKLYTLDSQITLMLISNPPTTVSEQVVDLGVAPEGATSITVTTTITGRTWTAVATPERSLPTRVMRIPVTVLPASIDPLTPRRIETALDKLLSADLNGARDGGGMFLSIWSPKSPNVALPDGVTIGARVEVLQGTEVMYSGTVCIWNSESRYKLPWSHVQQLPGRAQIQLTPQGRSSPTDSIEDSAGWSVRFVCEREIARMNPVCEEYFEGEFELPVSVDRFDWTISF